ncbi:hypothetical protein GCM10010405_50350 [Streptomyces macrosporus]|uniref:Uncharacterized protein n=1 Tax=Streptomyces macrosporus TaxID=44032 RepID=A0ABN3KI16_9ACTN
MAQGPADGARYGARPGEGGERGRGAAGALRWGLRVAEGAVTGLPAEAAEAAARVVERGRGTAGTARRYGPGTP